MVYDAIVLRSKSRECKNMPSNKYVLITDLDNTLFDWVDLWVNCFSSMLNSHCCPVNKRIDSIG